MVLQAVRVAALKEAAALPRALSMASLSPRCSETIFTRAEPTMTPAGARFERAPDVSGRGDAEAEQGGRGLGPLEVADDALCGRARGVVGAGDADAREQIGVSARESRDSCDALVGGVGRHDGDEVQARLAGGLVPFRARPRACSSGGRE